MTKKGRKVLLGGVFAALTLLAVGGPQRAWSQAAASSRVMGTVDSVNGNTVTVKTDAGATANVTVPDTARILRTAPGQKTLAGATKIGVSDIGAGDRVLMVVAGNPGGDDCGGE